jgi:hypothetical protein
VRVRPVPRWPSCGCRAAGPSVAGLDDAKKDRHDFSENRAEPCLSAPNGRSQDLLRSVGTSHPPGSLLAGTVRC